VRAIQVLSILSRFKRRKWPCFCIRTEWILIYVGTCATLEKGSFVLAVYIYLVEIERTEEEESVTVIKIFFFSWFLFNSDMSRPRVLPEQTRFYSHGCMCFKTFIIKYDMYLYCWHCHMF
jgi:hypothetical protein